MLDYHFVADVLHGSSFKAVVITLSQPNVCYPLATVAMATHYKHKNM